MIHCFFISYYGSNNLFCSLPFSRTICSVYSKDNVIQSAGQSLSSKIVPGNINVLKLTRNINKCYFVSNHALKLTNNPILNCDRINQAELNKILFAAAQSAHAKMQRHESLEPHLHCTNRNNRSTRLKHDNTIQGKLDYKVQQIKYALISIKLVYK